VTIKLVLYVHNYYHAANARSILFLSQDREISDFGS